MVNWSQLANTGIQSLLPYQPGKPIEELQRELGIREVIKLASNENPLGASPKALAALQTVWADSFRYPDGAAHHLKQGLAQHLNVPVDMITLGNGSDEVFQLVVHTFLTPQHNAIVSEYAFAAYGIAVRGANAQLITVPEKNWTIDLAAMLAAINKDTRVIFLANPNNPTGTWVNAAQLEHFLQQVPNHVLVIVDEAYYEYVDRPDYPNTLAWLAKYPHLMVTRTFSKAYGLAGLRCGYGISHPVIADLLNRIRLPFNSNILVQTAALAALQDSEHLAQTRAMNCAGMQQLLAAFEAKGLFCIPSAGNFITVDMGKPALPIYSDLLKQGIIVRPLANYPMPNFLRITVGTQAENNKSIAALSSIV